MSVISANSYEMEEGPVELGRMRWRRVNQTVVHNDYRGGGLFGASLELPPSTKNHTATYYEGNIILFGGFNSQTNNRSVYLLDVKTGEWQLRPTVGTLPAGRNGHTATLANGKIFVIGGWLGAGPYASAEVFSLDPHTWSWEKLDTSSEGPGPCNMHTADYIELSPRERFIFLFRGGDGQSYLNDLHLLDVDRLTWRKPITRGTPPAPRANHSSAVFNKKLFIFGGWDGQSRLSDLYILDAATLTWSCPETHGIHPTPRAGSTLTAVSNGLLLFGGSGPHSSCFNDIHLFDPTTNTWHKGAHEVDPDVPSLRTASEPGRQGMGLESGNTRSDNPNLSQPNPVRSTGLIYQGTPPEQRAGHSATLVGNRQIFIIGGSFQTEYLKTIYELDLDPTPVMKATTHPPIEMFMSTLGKLFNSEMFSDVTFRVEGESIYCHRLVLSTQSDYFRILFEAKFQEAHEQEITIKDVSALVFKQMIQFIYTGSVPALDLSCFDDAKESRPFIDANEPQAGRTQTTSHPNASVADMESRMIGICDLLVVADRFVCEHLKERCEIALTKFVDGRTASSLLRFAKVNRADKLLKFTQHYERWGGH